MDGTAGGAGHSCQIAKRLTDGKLFALDKDPDAVNIAEQRLAPYAQATVIQADFRDLCCTLKERGITGVDGILLDLGVSSYQLDTTERGFSYHQDAPLDMRMSKTGRVPKIWSILIRPRIYPASFGNSVRKSMLGASRKI